MIIKTKNQLLLQEQEVIHLPIKTKDTRLD
jgi:hypothetical protein